MTSTDDKVLMSARADVAELLAHVVCGACGSKDSAWAHEHGAVYTCGMWERMSNPMKPILFRKCRLEKDESNGGKGNNIRATLVARETRGKFGWKLNRRVVVCGWSDEDVPGSFVYRDWKATRWYVLYPNRRPEVTNPMIAVVLVAEE